MNDPRLKNPAWFRHLVSDRTRFADTDMFGHVNNAVFATYFEIGRAIVGELKRAALPDPDRIFVVGRVAMDLLGEITYPSDFTVGTALLRLGRSSVTVGQAIWVDGRVVATGEITHILYDRATKRSMPLPDDLAASFAAIAPADPAEPPDPPEQSSPDGGMPGRPVA